MDSVIALKEKIKLNPLSITSITICREPINIIHEIDLSQCINLSHLSLQNSSFNEINLTNCVNLTHLTLSGTIITHELNLMNCINLTHLRLDTSCIKDSGQLYKANLTNCVNVTNCINLTHVDLNYNNIDVLKLPDFSKCIKLQSFKCNCIYLNLELFPDIIEYKGLQCGFNYVSYIREKIKIEERLNKLEEDNRELRKIIDELRQPKSKYM
jgi:hypothetical protein